MLPDSHRDAFARAERDEIVEATIHDRGAVADGCERLASLADRLSQAIAILEERLGVVLRPEDDGAAFGVPEADRMPSPLGRRLDDLAGRFGGSLVQIESITRRVDL